MWLVFQLHAEPFGKEWICTLSEALWRWSKVDSFLQKLVVVTDPNYHCYKCICTYFLYGETIRSLAFYTKAYPLAALYRVTTSKDSSELFWPVRTDFLSYLIVSGIVVTIALIKKIHLCSNQPVCWRSCPLSICYGCCVVLWEGSLNINDGCCLYMWKLNAVCLMRQTLRAVSERRLSDEMGEIRCRGECISPGPGVNTVSHEKKRTF